MTRLTIFIIFIFCSELTCGQINKTNSEHFKVRYETEAEEFVQASLKVLESAWTIAIRNGYNLPDNIKFNVRKTDRSVLYFNRKNLREITLEYKTMDSFNSPRQGGKNNIYGLCHELGHLCMYNSTSNKNNWMSYNFRESWADFWGNVVIDSIYSELGTQFWPKHYNYLEFSGSEYMKKRIDQNNSKLEDFNKSGLFWMELSSIIGFNKMNQIFEQVSLNKVSNPNAKHEFLLVLKAVGDEKEVKELFDQYSDVLILDKK